MTQTNLWQQYPAVRGQISARQVGSDKVVLDLGSGMFFTLNEVGGFLWDRIDGRTSLAAILERLLAEYDVAEATAREDISRIVGELAKEGLIELRAQPVAEA